MAEVSLNPNFDAVGREFVGHYYRTFASNRTLLKDLYGAHSMMTWEDKQFAGADRIAEGINALSFKTVEHVITKADCQPAPNNGILVFVTGDIKIDSDAPLKFAQIFHLVPTPGGRYIIFNDLFRLNIG